MVNKISRNMNVKGFVPSTPRPDENSILKSTEAGLKADFKLASADRAELRAECERLKTMVRIHDTHV